MPDQKPSDYIENDFEMTGLRPQEKHILAMHSILESFGSCATRRNPNSSRLGKMIKVYFPAGRNEANGAGATKDGSSKQDLSPIACTQIQVAMLDRGQWRALMRLYAAPGTL